MAENADGSTQLEPITLTNLSKSGTPLIVACSGNNSGSNGSSCNKSDIKISSDGVAKLNFSFLEEAGDSSLEPGEVITPPHCNSPVTVALTKTLPISSLAATNVAAPQTEAQVCEEKVRAILEIDALRRREESEKRKHDLEIQRQSGELDVLKDEKRKAKAERKRIKRIENEQRAARLALISDENEEHHTTDEVISKLCEPGIRRVEGRESCESGERISSSGDEDSDGDETPKSERDQAVRSVAVLSNSASAYHLPLPVGHLSTMPDGYIGNVFRPMNMFSRHIRLDFHHARGGYLPRMRGSRGGVNNAMRYPMYRPPFYGSGIRNHGPYHSQRLSHPTRGHSPILAPVVELKWTKSLPSVSYSCKKGLEVATTLKIPKNAETSFCVESNALGTKADEIDEKTKSATKQAKKASKKTKKDGKKSKSSEKEKRNSRLENCEKSNLRKIVKIRKSFEIGSLSKIDGMDLEKKPQLVDEIKIKKPRQDNDNIEKSIKSEKQKKTLDSVEKNILNPKTEDSKKEKNIKHENNTNLESINRSFDIFAESPTRTANKSHRSETPPIELLPVPVTDLPVNILSSEKTHLQKAIEMQQRIGKLLQDDDLKPETLAAAKEKLLKTTQNLVYGPIAPPSLKKEHNNIERPSLQFELKTKLEKSTENKKNPFKRSISRNRETDSVKKSKPRNKSREKSFDSKKSYSREHSHDRDHQSNSRRSHSRHKSQTRREKEKLQLNVERSSSKRRSSRSPSHPTLAPYEKCRNSKSRERKIAKLDDKSLASSTEKLAKSKKSKIATPTPLSFNASEFLFPEDDDDTNMSEHENSKLQTKNKNDQEALKQQPKKTSLTVENDFIEDDDTTASSSLQFQAASTVSNKRSSPDTDDYMDNWELDDPDSSNATADAAVSGNTFKTLKPKSGEENINKDVGLKNQNQKDLKNTNINTDSFSHGLIDQKKNTKSTLTLVQPQDSTVTSLVEDNKRINAHNVVSSDGKNKEKSAMHDIYNEFIKSVEATGVEITQTPPMTNTPLTEVKRDVEEIPGKRAVKRNLSTSSSSSSSSSSSNSSTNSSSSTPSSSSSSSSSSTLVKKIDTANVSDKECENLAMPKNVSVKQNQKTKKKCDEQLPVVNTTCNDNDILTIQSTAQKSGEKKEENLQITNSDSSSQNSSRVDPVEVLLSVLPPSPNEAQKAQIAKDLKRVKAYDANLKRTQIMRSNFDSSDDIFGELAKMEKLFKHAINFIIQKYTKDRQVLLQTDVENLLKPTLKLSALNKIPPIDLSGSGINTSDNKFNKFGPADIRTESVVEATNEASATTNEKSASPPAEKLNKIFDSNRETIKMTIAPLKLTKPPAIFDKLDKASESNSARSRSSSEVGAEDTDFTETLVRTTKEIAIVKPMSKSGKSPSPRHNSSKRSSPRSSRSHGGHESSGRRSSSRSSSSYRGNEYRSRRSTSRSRVSSGQRRGRTATVSVSPPRRGGNSRHDSPKRRGRNLSPSNRNRDRGDRRSRSPARRPMSRRDISPHHRRRRPLPGSGSDARGSRHYDMRHSYSRSRSRSPGSSHYRTSGRPHSPRSPPPMGQRRSYSRDRYSRSPLPFKPPSPPEQQEGMRRSLSTMSGHCHRSRSYSPSPSRSPRRSRSPRSPRSPCSPRSPRSPCSPRSPRPHTPTTEYDLRGREGSYDMYRSDDSQHHSYYPVQHMGSMSASGYYYELPPNTLHGSEAEHRNISGVGPSVYNNYNEANYNQYPSGASTYLPQHGMQMSHTEMDTANSTDFYGTHFAATPTSVGHNSMSNSIDQGMYTGSMQQQQQQHMHMTTRPNNFYYNNQAPMSMPPHQARQMQHATSSSLLKELPKATVAVQKGNVLEIVPSELSHSPAVISVNPPVTVKVESVECTVPPKPSKPIDPVKEEIMHRLQESAKLREARKSNSSVVPSKTSILKKEIEQSSISNIGAPVADKENVDAKTTITSSSLTSTTSITSTGKTVKTRKKKVLFEDGLFPDRDSDDEDAKDAENRLRLELRYLRKNGRKAVTVAYLLSTRKPGAKQKPTMSELSKLPPPPPPPPHSLSPHLEQPIPSRPQTPPRYMFYHYDTVVHALYTSPSERGIPPRLTDPKAAAIFATGKATGTGPTIRPRSSPIFTMKRDLIGNSVNTLKMATVNQNIRGCSSPQLTPPAFYGPRRVNINFNKQIYSHPPPQTFNPSIHHARFAAGGSPISTLSTQPLSQPKTVMKAMAATFQTLPSNTPQMPLMPMHPTQMQQHHLQQKIQTTSSPINFVNNLDTRVPPPQHPIAYPPPTGSIAHPRGVHMHHAVYPNITQQMTVMNGASTVTPIRPQMAPSPSYGYNPFMQHPMRPSTATAIAKAQNLPQPIPRTTQNFDTLPNL